MLWTPQKGCVRVITNAGIVGTGSPGTAVTSHGTVANNMGGVVELISAANNNQESWGISVWIEGGGLAGNAAQRCVWILIGGATDDVLIPSLICGYSLAIGNSYNYFFPIHVPGGLRIAADTASVRLGVPCRVTVHLYGGCPPPWRVGRKVTAYGTKIDNSRGQAVTPSQSGAAASVTELTASTSEDHFAFLPGFQPATDSTVTPTTYTSVGIGVGAATEDRIGSWYFGKTTSEDAGGPVPNIPAFCDVPSGSRLTMLASNGGANDAAYDGLIYAVS